MRRAHALALVATVTLSSAIAGCATQRPPAAVPASTDEICAPPFTAEQIRAATRAGRTYDFETTQPGGPAMLLRMRFATVSAEGATLERGAIDASGALLGPAASSTVTWAELVKHAAWPKSATTVEPAEVEVPAGKFTDAMLYTVREVEDGKPRVTRAWFSRGLPGAPVLHVVELDGREVSRMRLIAHRAE